MQDLKIMLEQLNVPVAYDHFNSEINPPFIVFERYSQSNFGADDIVYEVINNYYVYLYTEYKDLALEAELEKLFTDNGIFYNVEGEEYINDEKMYQIIYSIGYKEPKRI